MADILLGNVKGPQGNTGATGSQGPQGEAATITVGTVSTTAYGNTASVTNSGTEQDAVLDFVIPQGKPGEQTTRMGALTLDTITAQSADFPIPVVGETGSTVFGKIIKFFNSTVSALNSKLNISDVVNNLTSTSTTQPLSAAQGKALNDALSSVVNTTIQSYTPELVRTNGSTVIGQDTTSASKVGKYVKIGNKVFVFASIKTRITESGEYPCITLPYHAVNSNMPFAVAELTQNFQSTAAHINTSNVSSSQSVASIRDATGTSAVKTSTMASGTSAYISFSGWYLTDQ